MKIPIKQTNNEVHTMELIAPFRLWILLAVTLIATLSAFAQTPTMGWSSWNTYRVNISDSLIMAQADALVSSGLAEAGYR